MDLNSVVNRLASEATLDEKLVRLHQYLTRELEKRGLLEEVSTISAAAAAAGAPSAVPASAGVMGGPLRSQTMTPAQATALPALPSGETLRGTSELVMVPGIGYVEPHPNQISSDGYPVNENIIRTIDDQYFDLYTGQMIDPDDSDDGFWGWLDDSEVNVAMDNCGYIYDRGNIQIAADLFE